jgi:hypothetical protein
LRAAVENHSQWRLFSGFSHSHYAAKTWEDRRLFACRETIFLSGRLVYILLVSELPSILYCLMGCAPNGKCENKNIFQYFRNGRFWYISCRHCIRWAFSSVYPFWF